MTDDISFWKKTPDQMTVEDNVKYVALITPVAMAAPFVALALVGAAALAVDKTKTAIDKIKKSRKEK